MGPLSQEQKERLDTVPLGACRSKDERRTSRRRSVEEAVVSAIDPAASQKKHQQTEVDTEP